MKIYRFLILIFLFTSTFQSFSTTNNCQNINDSYLFSQRFFPIGEGSSNQKKIVDFLKNFSEKNNLEYKETKVSGNSYETNAVNIELTMPGTSDEDSTILIVAPLNSIYGNGKFQDISLSQCLALQLLEYAGKKPFQKRLKVVFLGGSSIIQEPAYGLEQYLKENSGFFINTFAILLKINNSFMPITISASKNKKPVPALIIEKIFSCIKKNNCANFSVSEIIRSRLNILNKNAFLDAFLDENINAVLLSNTSNYKNTSGNYYNVNYQKQLFQFITDYCHEIDSIPSNFEKDQNYLIQDFKLGKKNGYLLIPEYKLLLIYFIILFCSVLLFKIIMPFRNPIRLSQICSSVPFFIFSFLVLYVISFIPFLFEILISLVHHLPFSYGRSMFFYFVSIFIILALFSFFILDVAPKIHLPLKWKNNLYLQIAIYCTYINLFTIAAVDISLSYVYFLFLFFITLSMMFKKIWLKFLCYILSFAGFFFVLFSITQNSNSVLIDLSKSVFLLHFMFCLFAFPFLMASIHIYRIIKMKVGTSGKYHISRIIILIFMCILPQMISIHHSNKNESQDINVSIIHDYNQKTDFISMRSDKAENYKMLKKIEISDLHTGKQYTYNASKNKILEIHPVQAKDYSCKVTSHGSLHTIKIKSKRAINKIDAILVCPENIEPLHTNFRKLPIKEVQTSTYDLFRLLLPRNCGNNIDLQLELLPGHEYTLNLEITFRDPQMRFLFFPLENFYDINEKNKESIKLK